LQIVACADKYITMASSDPLTDRESKAWRGFLRAHAALWKEMGPALEAGHGLTINAYDVLVLLDEAPEGRRRMTDLANSVLMTSGGFTRLADRLCARGYIERERVEGDGRGFDAVLTDAGREALEAARVTHRADIREKFLSQVSPEEQEVLGAVFTRLLSAERPR
jgi:DNA-binding MarR family transcriptional regulator